MELGGRLAAEEAEAPVWLRIQGPEVSWPEAPSSILATFLANFRKGVQAATEWSLNKGLSTRPTKAIKQACDSAHLRNKRADDIWANSTIIQDIVDLIFVAEIVVVDFTGKNPNVMYETGIAHTLGKHVVPITQSIEHVPFDLQSHRVLQYHPNQEGLTKLTRELTSRLRTITKGHSWHE
jgi:hypothetical protein